MEDEGIQAVLAKATDLRLKISNCIHKATTTNITSNKKTSSFEEEEQESEGLGEKGWKKKSPESSEFLDGVSLSEAEDDETERFFHIRDALESLESQLSNLQALQQQQHYEKEVALSEIEHSRKILLDKLKEYRGEDLEVIKEASVFAGETVGHNNDLLLPPYPSRHPQSLVLNNRYLYHFHSKCKSNGIIAGGLKRHLDEPESNQAQTASASKNSRKGLGHFINAAAKTVITIVGVISVLCLASFGPGIGKKGAPLRVLGLFQQPALEERKQTVQCPPGKILVLEDGEARCVVKGRVAVPFNSLIGKPDVNYGSG
ncbi:PLASTID DIVISION PROTEIN PDV2 [Salix koriyanagi]|uniref:PLASTID DIVISION PROTEIN PDV2 n=1 Tax=Salix koriyanagi TaxID=2511006 RepID=A0A9Q0UYV2_9ROSI|nr:PLASTID DIVISION PROTEIN PDV2 [Salix koriyanagi]